MAPRIRRWLPPYSCIAETSRLFSLLAGLVDDVSLPAEAVSKKDNLVHSGVRDQPYFPTPFKQTELAAALKSIEGCLAALLADLRDGQPSQRSIYVDQERVTAFLCQGYLATIGGLGKMDYGVDRFLKDTDLHKVESDHYRRFSAGLYHTAHPGNYYHIHGSLEASTTLRMIGLEAERPDLFMQGNMASAVVVEAAVSLRTPDELEALNAQHRQAGVRALKHSQYMNTSHALDNSRTPPWSVHRLEDTTPACALMDRGDKRLLAGIKVLDLSRIIAGPVISRILAEYGADVLKITSPNLSDVSFFQVDVNMGKKTADLDLKTAVDKAKFDELLKEADVVVDGYRPGALTKLGYGPEAVAKMAAARGRGIVYVTENCFGYQGEWAARPGWHQTADSVSGVAWDQGLFMGLREPVMPPFPMADYGTGCMGAIAALTGLYHRAKVGGSWHAKVSLLQYDLLLYKADEFPDRVRKKLRRQLSPEFRTLRHARTVDQVSAAALRHMKSLYPDFFVRTDIMDHWWSQGYQADIAVVRPVVQVAGLEISFQRASRPNGTDEPSWDFSQDEDVRKDEAESLNSIWSVAVP